MIYWILIAISVLLLIVILNLVLKHKLQLKYSILWITYSVILLILSLNVDLLEKISKYLGILYTPSMIFLFGLFFLILYTIHLSIVVTKQNKYITKLTQEFSILKTEFEKKSN